ncbi:hypothetical protein L1987_74193 [Smallanthus sonchifolius]|uniref:Uncharacterized protein n=1 Tax=Smallanthus sonchifolius TaxID=185202 RepID=A0ACB9A2D0_9ASTR|nr:hypothetical protein L1987_74193 [Smallanthus sonchifolius]
MQKHSSSSSSLLNKAPNGLSVGGLDSSGVLAAGLTGIEVDISVEFSYRELSTATNDFSLANKIGQGGFGAAYYAELRGEKAAIKKMNMEASKQFLAELKVLTHVHHLNLGKGESKSNACDDVMLLKL